MDGELDVRMRYAGLIRFNHSKAGLKVDLMGAKSEPCGAPIEDEPAEHPPPPPSPPARLAPMASGSGSASRSLLGEVEQVLAAKLAEDGDSLSGSIELDTTTVGQCRVNSTGARAKAWYLLIHADASLSAG